MAAMCNGSFGNSANSTRDNIGGADRGHREHRWYMVLNVNTNGNDENGGNSIKLKQPTAELFFLKKKKKLVSGSGFRIVKDFILLFSNKKESFFNSKN